jgi:isoleucyl-tRNA synthetase
MDWGNDYFTFSDTNIEYIWRFLQIVDERGWLYLGHRATEWCPRCGTSLSQHELTQSGVYQERGDPSLFVRFPLLDRPGESVVVWTTTPWTLPANVAAAVNPEGEYGLRENGEWVLAGASPTTRSFARSRLGARRPSLPGAVRHSCARRFGRAPHRRLGRGLPRGGHRDRAHRNRLRRRGLRARPSLGLPVLTPVDEAGHFYDDYGWLHGLSTGEASDQIVGDLSERGFLVSAGTYLHNYPHCWRCDTPLIFRLSDDWFIGVDGVRAAAARGERRSRVGARVHGQAHGRLAAEHG